MYKYYSVYRYNKLSSHNILQSYTFLIIFDECTVYTVHTIDFDSYQSKYSYSFKDNRISYMSVYTIVPIVLFIFIKCFNEKIDQIS